MEVYLGNASEVALLLKKTVEVNVLEVKMVTRKRVLTMRNPLLENLVKYLVQESCGVEIDIHHGCVNLQIKIRILLSYLYIVHLITLIYLKLFNIKMK